MTLFIIVGVIVILFVLGGILLLKDNAKKFKLTPEQQRRVELRKQAMEKQDEEQK